MATSFLQYLESLKTSLESLGQNTELYLTSGNQSCDLDSIVSALAYAYYIARKVTPSTSEAIPISLPLLQCRREDLVLNQEVTKLFDMLGIDGSGILFLDDVTPAILSAVGKLSLTLVDHNVPTGMLEPFSSRVTKVIDHHQKSDNSVSDQAGVTATMKVVGSCASLVATEVMEDEMEEPLAILLLSAILLDTGNLKAAERVTNTDETAAEKLKKFLPSSFNCDELYNELFKRRFDISKLSIEQVLRKDYKECKVNDRYTIGFSSITALLSDFLTLKDMKQKLVEFCSTHKLAVYIISGISMPDPNASMVRQIAVYQPEGAGSELSQSIAGFLEANSELKCKRMEAVAEFGGVVLEQGNVNMSRKHIIPILTSFMSSVESEYPGSPLSPSAVVMEEIKDVTLASGLEVSSEQPFPLEPTVTVISKPLEDPSSSCISTSSQSEKRAGVQRTIPEYLPAEERKDERSHRLVNVGGEEVTISMDLVKPYKKIIQHAGYVGETRQAVVVLSACYLPPRSLPNYNHVIHHTFYYILSVLDALIVENYTIVYLHSGAPRNSMPSIQVLHRFYRMIDRRLRKQLTKLFIVHPTFWVKTILHLSRPFISKKFWRKVTFIATLQDLSQHIQVDQDYISAPVLAVDKTIVSQRPSKQKYTIPLNSKTTDTEGVSRQVVRNSKNSSSQTAGAEGSEAIEES